MVHSLAILLLSVVQLSWQVTDPEPYPYLSSLLGSRSDAVAIVEPIGDSKEWQGLQDESGVLKVRIVKVIEQVFGPTLDDVIYIPIYQRTPSLGCFYPGTLPSPTWLWSSCPSLVLLKDTGKGYFYSGYGVELSQHNQREIAEAFRSAFSDLSRAQSLETAEERRNGWVNCMIRAVQNPVTRMDALRLITSDFRLKPSGEIVARVGTPEMAFTREQSLELAKVIDELESFGSVESRLLLLCAPLGCKSVDDGLIEWRKQVLNGSGVADRNLILEYVHRLGKPSAREYLETFWSIRSIPSCFSMQLSRWTFQPDRRLFWSSEKHRLKALRLLEGFPD
ncbi:MAG: hypothetical protein HQ519_09120 [Planctomycetes bacterium]|nr:hypothetical protein [Planctomycetota bacterium]